MSNYDGKYNSSQEEEREFKAAPKSIFESLGKIKNGQVFEVKIMDDDGNLCCLEKESND